MINKSLKGQQISPAAMTWLAGQRPARLLNLFDQVCYLVDDQGQVMALATPAVGPGPFSLVVESAETASWPGFTSLLPLDSPVEYGLQTLRVGHLAIDLAPAVRWSPRPAWRRLPPSLLQALWPDLTRWLLDNAPDGSLAELLARPAPERGNGQAAGEILAAASVAWRQLAIALGREYPEKAVEAAQQLAGLGSGLTPAGDDLLVGIMYALWVAWPADKTNPWVIRLAGAAMPRTGDLSAAWLAAAARGEAVPDWHELIDALVAADEPRWSATMSRILGTGHTSGADALAGFLLASRVLFI